MPLVSTNTCFAQTFIEVANSGFLSANLFSRRITRFGNTFLISAYAGTGFVGGFNGNTFIYASNNAVAIYSGDPSLAGNTSANLYANVMKPVISGNLFMIARYGGAAYVGGLNGNTFINAANNLVAIYSGDPSLAGNTSTDPTEQKEAKNGIVSYITTNNVITANSVDVNATILVIPGTQKAAKIMSYLPQGAVNITDVRGGFFTWGGGG